MKELSFYLEKFKNVGLDEVRIKKATKEVLQELIGISLEDKDIIIKKDQGTIVVYAHPVVKNELYMKREIILAALKQKITSPVSRIR